MKKLKAVCALSLAGLLLFSLSGCGGEKKEPVKAGTQKLTVYWGALEDFMAADVAAFEKETGIKVTAVRMSSGETLKRLQAEKTRRKHRSGSAGRQTARFRPKRTDCWKNTFLPTLPKFPTVSKIRTASGQVSM